VHAPPQPGFFASLLSWFGGGPAKQTRGDGPTHNYYVRLKPDGSFKLSGVEPGEYNMLMDPDPNGSNRKSRYYSFKLPPANEGHTSASLDLGTITPEVR
jgi:hypothetical protein